ncbi:serine/threonine-protein kinase [Baekduia sp.]|jgi:serine/threonine-protein kinase|uniref:serine/threonine-protein kinase n=1 Tax=Baekduia sp. TaxID=2600305 RepID=UPI002DFFCFB6|nr:serine/threonine-protein kinase [Baekduia sp.]
MLAPGTEIAGYRIEGVLGRGGMGSVYEATQLSLLRTIALKILGEELSVDDAFKARFRQEGRIQGGINHPHIVTVHEAGEVDGHLFIAMQLVRGPTLKRMALSGELDAQRAIRLLTQVAGALDGAHAAGLTHRDVKPQNVLVGPGDHAYLADFGLTKALANSGGYTRTGQIVGTIDYISPEQISGAPATSASDIYALGAILYETLTGRVPFPRDSEAAVLFAHVSGAPPRVSDVRDDLPRDLDDVIARAMDKDPAQRPTTAGSLMEQAYAALAAQSGGSRQRRAPSADEDPGLVGAGGGSAPVLPQLDEEFPPTMTPGSRLIPPESDPSFSVPDHLPVNADGASAGQTPVTVPAPAVHAPSVRGLATRSLAGVVVVAVLGAGLAFGRSGAQHPAAAASPLTRSASNGAARVRFPATWSESAESAVGEALRLTEPISLATADAGATFDAGITKPPVTPGLLAVAATGEVVGALPAPERVRIGALPAYRYRDVRLRGVDGPVTVLAAPTTEGVLTIACGGAASQADACARVAGTIALRRGRSMSLGADPVYAQALGRAMGRLNVDRHAARRRLAAAGGPQRQAQAATAAAAGYTRAAKALAATAPGPADVALRDALHADLAGIARAYTALATAAGREDKTAYAAASATVRRREQAFGRHLARLKAAGYRAA